METLGIPFNIFIQLVVQLWEVFGLPILFGTFLAGVTEYVKDKPAILPWVEKGKKWGIRLFIVLIAVAVEAAIIISTKGFSALSLAVLITAGKNYAGAALAYTHLFKVLPKVLPRE